MPWPTADNTKELAVVSAPSFSHRNPSRRRARWPGLMLVCGAVLFGHPARAAETKPAGLTEETYLEEMPVVLSATRLSQPLSETPASVTVIDHDMIEASGALDIPEVLRLVPGFQVGHVFGHTYTVTYHGLSDQFSRRMQVLVDGRSVYTPAFGGMDWSALPLAIEDVDRIEVIRGPDGVTYGANSFAAVINIITRDPIQDQGTLGEYTQGSINTKKGLLRYGGTAGDLNYRVTAGYRQDDGFKESQPDGKQISLLTWRGDYTATDNDNLQLQLGLTRGFRGQGEYNNDTTDPQRDENVTESFEQLRWRHTISSDEETSLQFYHNYHEGTDKFDTPPLSQLLSVPPAMVPVLLSVPDQALTLDRSILTDRYDLEFQHTLSPYPRWRFVWGAETRLDRVRAPGFLDTSRYVDTRLYRLFGNAEWRFAPDWILNAGAMYEQNTITGGDVSPRVGVNYHLTPDHTLRASVSRAYRTPSVFEFAANYGAWASDRTLIEQSILSTRRLKPERITSYEVGYLGEFPAIGTSVDLKIFREEIRDVITLASDSSIPNPIPGYTAQTFVNDGFANINGAEMQLRMHFTPHTQLVVSEAYADQHGQMLTEIAPTPAYDDTHDSTPTLTTSALFIHHFARGAEASAAYYHQTHMRFLGQGSEHDTGGYSALDLRLAYKVRVGNLRGEISVVAQNLLGNYFDYANYNVLGRRYFVTLGLGSR